MSSSATRLLVALAALCVVAIPAAAMQLPGKPAAEAAAAAPAEPGAAAAEAGAAAPAGSRLPPGFWSWPREKLSADAAAEACESQFAVQFADGHYFGVVREGNGLPKINEVGLCAYDASTGIERCTLTVTEDDGTALHGTMENTFTEEDGVLRMAVKVTTERAGADPTEASFDVFPVQCPDSTVWDSLYPHGAESN